MTDITVTMSLEKFRGLEKSSEQWSAIQLAFGRASRAASIPVPLNRDELLERMQTTDPLTWARLDQLLSGETDG